MRTKSNLSQQRLTRLGGPQVGTATAVAIGQDAGPTLLAGTPVGLYRSRTQKGKTNADWERLANAPIGIISLALSPGYAVDHTIFAGTDSGIYLSHDSGDNWLAAASPIEGSVINSIAFSPEYAEDGLLLAGTLEDGILFSPARGEKWLSRNFGMLDAAVFSLAFSPNFAQDETAYAGTDTAVYHSYNGGLAWKLLSFPEEAAPALCLAISPHFQDDDSLFVGTETHGLYRSTDRGVSWDKLDLPADCVNALLQSEAHQGLLAATDAGIFLSADQGETWTCLLDNPDVISLAAMGEIVMAGLVNQGVWMTTNGADWGPVTTLSTSSLVGAALSPEFEQDGAAFLFGPQEGIWRTEDGGGNWASLNEDLPSLDILALELAPDFSSSRKMAAGTPAGVLLSEDAGQQWRRAANEAAGLVAFSPNGKLLAASFPQEGVRVTEDFGKTWQPVPAPWGAGGRVAALEVANSGQFYMAVVEGVGATLSIWQGQPGEFERAHSLPVGKNPLVSFWIPAEPAPDRPWYASLGNMVWKLSGRKGRAASKAVVFPADESGEDILTLTGVQTAMGQVLLAATSRRVFKSVDGQDWTLAHDFGNERAVALVLSPNYAKDKTLYALLLGGSFGSIVIH